MMRAQSWRLCTKQIGNEQTKDPDPVKAFVFVRLDGSVGCLIYS